MLSYAYYAKYKSAVSAKKENALQYLSRSALYTPKTLREKTAGSADHFFLKFDDYRQLLINQLLGNNDDQQALKVLTEYLSTEPEMIKEMQTLSEKDLRPGTSYLFSKIS